MDHYPVEARDYPLSEWIPASVREAQRRKFLLLTFFVVIAIGSLLLGFYWPKTFVASTSILVNEDDIIQELMAGRAVPTSVHDRRLIAREVLFSRRVMNEVLRKSSLINESTTRAERERLARLVESRTTVGSPRENLLMIEYRDTDPQRAFLVTSLFSQLLISESRAAKLKESRDAYEFISAQVANYHNKLLQAEADLSAYRESSPEARPGSLGEVNLRISELRRNIEAWSLELLELRSRRDSLEAQLATSSEASGNMTWQAELRARIRERQDQLDTMLLDLTPRHPDVVRVRGQVEQLKTELEQLQISKQDDETNSQTRLEENELQTELAGRLGEVKRDINAVASRIDAAQRLLKDERRRALAVTESETGLAERTRTYDVNREVYQDLLRRLENARLSLSLEEQGRGLTFSVHEPPDIPARASGFRFLHFAGAGLATAFALPFGLIALFVRFDPRVRSAAAVERQSGLPVIGQIPAIPSTQDRRRNRRRNLAILIVLIFVMAAYAGAGWIKLVGAI